MNKSSSVPVIFNMSLALTKWMDKERGKLSRQASIRACLRELMNKELDRFDGCS